MTSKRAGRELVFPRDVPSLRVELMYAYLMAWFAFHCPVLMQPREEPPKGERHAHLHRFKNSQWKGKYLAGSGDWSSVKTHIVSSDVPPYPRHRIW